MPYSNLWNETTPTVDTLANTIAPYFTDNMKAIRERLDDVFGTSGASSIATADPYNISYIRMQGVTDSGVIGGTGSWSVFDSTNVFKNLQVLDSGSVIIRSGILSTLATSIQIQSTDGMNNNVVINDNGSVVIRDGISVLAGTGIVAQFAISSTSGAVTIDLSQGNNQSISLNAASVLTLSNGVAGGVYLLKISYTGSGSLAFANLNYDNADTTPAFTNTPSTSDLVTIYYDGTNYFGVAAGLNFSV